MDGRPVLATEATYTLETVRFSNPQAVAGAIPDLLDAAIVAQALSGALPTNADRLCYHAQQVDCGKLNPAVAGVIFDEATFRVDIFVHRDQRRVHALAAERFLPPPTADDLATVHQLNLALSDAGFDIGGTSIVSRGADRVVARYESARRSVGVSELLWQRDAHGRRYEAGLFRSLGRNALFVGEHSLAGVRIGTALDLRADLEAREGSPIFLFLDQRSRVDVFRGARLIDSGFYEAGNRQLDTTRLPDGAYEITVRMTGNDGRQREESFFFVRSGRVPPLGETIRYAELGSIVEAPNPASGTLASGGWARAGLARRLGNAWGVDAEMLSADNDLLGQAGVFGFGKHWQLRANAMLGSGGASGYWLQLRSGHERWSAGLDLRALNARDVDSAQPTLFASSLRQSALTLNFPWRRGRVTLRGQLDQSDENARTWSWGGSLAVPLRQRGALALELESDVLLAANDRTFRVSVLGRWRTDGRFSTVRGGVQHRAGSSAGTAPIFDARRARQWENSQYGQVTHTLLARLNGDQRAVGTAVTADANRGRGRADVQWLDGPDGGGISYSANARFGLTTDHGRIAMGGRQGDSAAVVIQVDGDRDDHYRVLVDGQRVADARGGERTLVSLPPYARYQVRIVPEGASMVSVDETARDVVLYPGNVTTLDFRARRVYVLVGQAIDAQGKPVTNAPIDLPGRFARTDEDGWFQVEVESLTPLRLTPPTAPACELTPQLSIANNADDSLHVLERALCVPYSGDTVRSTVPE